MEVCLVYKNGEDYFTEKVNVIKVDKFYQITAIPAFAKNISFGDIIEAEMENNELHFEKLIEESGHSTIHIVVFVNMKKIIDELKNFGCGVNYISENYLVVDIPPILLYNTIKEFLDEKEDLKFINYSESCISSIHRLSYN